MEKNTDRQDRESGGHAKQVKAGWPSRHQQWWSNTTGRCPGMRELPLLWSLRILISAAHSCRIAMIRCCTPRDWTIWGVPCIIMGRVDGHFVLGFLSHEAAASGGMGRFWNALEAEGLILWFAVLAILVAVAAYVIGKMRPKPVQDERRGGQWVLKCRESRSRGELSEEEFRTITTLASQLQDESSDNGEKG
jgi:uncharacterized membrane protein